jgi:hypothetical protein
VEGDQERGSRKGETDEKSLKEKKGSLIQEGVREEMRRG